MPAPGLSAVGQIAIAVNDFPAAVAFYKDTLGLPFLFDAPVVAGGPPAMAFFTLGDIRLLLGTAQAGQPVHPASILYFRTADIAAAHQALAGRGVKFHSPPHLVHRAPDHELWLAEFAAPEGSTHALMEERRVT